MMKKFFFPAILLFLLINAAVLNAQEIGNGFGAGMQIINLQNDFGAGVQLTTPYMVNRKIAFRVKGNVMFHEHTENGEITWTPYANATAGLIAVSGMVNEAIRLYSEGGIIGLFPGSAFSSERFEFGGYGLFGFEFFMTRKHNYFIELGGVGTGAKADRVVNSPVYSNGLSISAGFRLLF